MEKKHLAGMALIAIGLLLLLSNLGLLPRDIWPQLLRFWPLILICTGLVLVDQKGRWGVYLSLALVVAVLAGVIYYSYSGSFPRHVPKFWR
ncbi:MAG: hypothetical protein GX766_07420 [Firmicutes bacterium]|jgi:hypothetical protein|nr:hypothetical protein [Bacillota bacterium]HOB21731.1 DUF5668 domain-containing protein [Bacillota bacterium]HQD39171.1 DUF5668 domain-containing protein [Bacillota bacterium]